MGKVKYKFHYITGESEEFETEYEYKEDARKKMGFVLDKGAKWFGIEGKMINLDHVLSIEILGEKERMELKIDLPKPE